MRVDKRTQLSAEHVEELLDGALANYRGAEPRAGLEERVLANVRQQARAAQPVSWKLAPVMIAAVAVLLLITVERLMHFPVASEPAIVAGSAADESRGDEEAQPDVRRTQAVAREVVLDVARRTKPAMLAKRERAWRGRQDLALNRNFRQPDARAEGGLRIEEVRIAAVRLDEIVISNNERQE